MGELPAEIWMVIFTQARFSIEQALCVRAVCKLWRNLCTKLILDGDQVNDHMMLARHPSICGALDLDGPILFGGVRTITVLMWCHHVPVRPFGVSAGLIETIDLFYARPPKGHSWTTEHLRDIFAACCSLKVCRILGMRVDLADDGAQVTASPKLHSLRLMAASEPDTFRWSLQSWKNIDVLRRLSLSRWSGSTAAWCVLLSRLPALLAITVSDCPYFDDVACSALFAHCSKLQSASFIDHSGILTPRIIFSCAGKLKDLRMLRLDRDDLAGDVFITVDDLLTTSGVDEELSNDLFPALESFSIRGYRIPAAGLIAFVSALPSLQRCGFSVDPRVYRMMKQIIAHQRPRVQVSPMLHINDI